MTGLDPVTLRDARSELEASFVPGAGNLEKDLVLPLELDFAIVETPGEQHHAVQLEQIGLGERRACRLGL